MLPRTSGNSTVSVMKNDKDDFNVSLSLCDHSVSMQPKTRKWPDLLSQKYNEELILKDVVKAFVKKLNSLLAEYQTWYRHKSSRFFNILHSVQVLGEGIIEKDIHSMSQYRKLVQQTYQLNLFGEAFQVKMNILEEFLQLWTKLGDLVNEFRNSLMIKVSEFFTSAKTLQIPQYFAEFEHMCNFIFNVSSEDWPFARMKRFENEHLFTFGLSISSNEYEMGLVYVIPYIVGVMVKTCNLVNRIRVEKA